jgi:hypothetical protein
MDMGHKLGHGPLGGNKNTITIRDLLFAHPCHSFTLDLPKLPSSLLTQQVCNLQKIGAL